VSGIETLIPQIKNRLEFLLVGLSAKKTLPCRLEAQENNMNLRDDGTRIKNEATELLMNMAVEGAKCTLKPLTAAVCLTAVLNNLKTGTKSMENNFKDTILTYQKNYREVRDCIKNVKAGAN
jgi:hypothetical protein